MLLKVVCFIVLVLLVVLLCSVVGMWGVVIFISCVSDASGDHIVDTYNHTYIQFLPGQNKTISH